MGLTVGCVEIEWKGGSSLWEGGRARDSGNYEAQKQIPHGAAIPAATSCVMTAWLEFKKTKGIHERRSRECLQCAHYKVVRR